MNPIRQICPTCGEVWAAESLTRCEDCARDGRTIRGVPLALVATRETRESIRRQTEEARRYVT